MTETAGKTKMTTKDLMIVLVISLGSFMAGLDATIVNIALPTIGKSFDVSTVTVSWVLNAYLIVLVSLLLLASRLGDIRGFRNLFIAGFALFTLGSALCGLSPSIGFLVGARMLQAAGGAVISALGAVMVTSYLSSSLRGQALGIVAMFTMLGAALGPVIGGFLTSAYSWPYIFYVNVPVGIVAIVMGIHILPKMSPVSPGARIDFPGVALIFVALSSLIFGLTSIEGPASLYGGISLVISLVFWLVFLGWERRCSEPLINMGLFANRAYTLQNFNVLFIQLAMAGVMVLMPFYLELVKRIPTGNAGAILLALPIGMILTAPISGKISDVIGTKKPIITGFVLCAIALLLLSTLSAESSVGHVSIYLFLLGAGTGIAFSPLNSAVMGESPLKDRGASSGLVKMMTNLGSSVGVALVALVATAAIGPAFANAPAHTLPVADLARAFDLTFLVLMVIEIVGILLMAGVRERISATTSDEEPLTTF
jgi:EmrB/QacA subfamily drug resistance transporter